MAEERHIFKVQRSLFDSEGGDEILIYNEDKSIFHQQEVDDTNREAFDNIFSQLDEPKLFMTGYVNEDKMIVLEEQAEWQDW